MPTDENRRREHLLRQK